MSDPFEDFEFKPLTEGLGFNKKADPIKTPVKPTVKSQIQSTMAATHAATNAASTSASPSLNSNPVRSSIFPENAASEKRANAPAFESTRAANASNASNNLGLSAETTRAASQSISELMASLPPSLDFLDDKQDLTRKSEMSFGASPLATPVSPSTRPQIFQPLGREEYKSTLGQGPTVGSVLPAPGTRAGSGVSTSAVIAAPLNATAASAASMKASAATASRPGYRERMAETFGKAFPKAEETARKTTKLEATEEGLVPVAANFSAGLIDAMVVAGIATILLVCIITITHINLVAMLTNASTDTSTQKNLVFLFFAVLQMYMLVSRAFFGASLGEWAFENQLGTAEQSRQLYYPLQVLWRTFFVTITGVFAVPLLSFAFKRDLGRYVSGLQLYRRP